MTLSIVIVNWNSRELLRQCLRSIAATCGDLAPQIVVVDGGSFDGCGEMLAADFPHVEFVQSAENIGFGRSNNLGFARVTGDAVLLLNPDTEVRPGAVHLMLKELQERPQSGIVSARLLNSDYTLQSSVHALPRPVLQAFDSEPLRRALSTFSLWAPPSDFAPAETVKVEAVAGACMLLWTKTFQMLGGFNPAYFMYAEDMDLCLRVRRAGLRVYHVPAAEILHHSGASSATQGSKFSAVMMREALHDYMEINHGWLAGATYRAATAVSSVCRLMVMAPGLVLANDSRKAAVKAAMLRWRAILVWSFGGEKWAREYSIRHKPGVGPGLSHPAGPLTAQK